MLLASLILILLLILWIGPLTIINTLETANWIFICLAILIHLTVLIIRSVRWGFIIKQTTEFKKNFIVKIIGIFAGNLSPMKGAGEVLTAVAGKNINKIQLSEGLSAGLTERFFDLGIVGILLIVSASLITQIRYVAIIGGLTSLVVMFIIYLVNWRENNAIWLYSKIHPIMRKLPIKEETLDNIYQKFTQGLKGMIEYTQSFTSFKNISFVIILTLMSWLLECLRLYSITYAFNVKISFITVIIIFLLANVIGVISLLPGGMGSIEISVTGLFLLFNVPSALAGSIALIDRLISFWLVNILGIIFSSYYTQDILDEIKKYSSILRSPPN